MTDGDRLREAILARPDDDALRLVYADWLEETGTDLAQAELMRLHLTMRGDPPERGYAAMRDRCAELLHANGRRWIAATYGDTWEMEADAGGVKFWRERDGGTELQGWFWHGGMLGHVHLPLLLARRLLPGLVRRWPVRYAEVSDKKPMRVPEGTSGGTATHGWRQEQPPYPGESVDVTLALATLPGEVWDFVEGYDTSSPLPPSHWKDYPGSAAAHDALSDAMLRLANHKQKAEVRGR